MLVRQRLRDENEQLHIALDRTQNQRSGVPPSRFRHLPSLRLLLFPVAPHHCFVCFFTCNFAGSRPHHQSRPHSHLPGHGCCCVSLLLGWLWLLWDRIGGGGGGPMHVPGRRRAGACNARRSRRGSSGRPCAPRSTSCRLSTRSRSTLSASRSAAQHEPRRTVNARGSKNVGVVKDRIDLHHSTRHVWLPAAEPRAGYFLPA